MKRMILINLVLCLFSVVNVHPETIKNKGLEITITFEKSEFEDILEFLVKAKNTTRMEKTLLGTIYLNAEKYPGLSAEESSTVVYMELPASGTAEDTFYLITSIQIPSPDWYFKVDEVYDFIVETDFNNDENPESENFENGDKSEPGKEENEMFSITGYWKMEKNEDSEIYGNWSWLFNDDGTIKIEEILGAEARLPMSYEGSYELKGSRVDITLFSGSPFPGSFHIQGDKLVAENVVLIKTSDESWDF